MTKILKLIAFALLISMADMASAQVSVNVHIGTTPAWGPDGYAGVRYYYLPDIQAYYDVETEMFIYYYYSGHYWVHHRYLPSRYRNYDLYNGYKVVMTDYHGKTPYTHYREHRLQYARGYRGNGPQKTFGHRPDNYRGGTGRHDEGHGSPRKPSGGSSRANKPATVNQPNRSSGNVQKQAANRPQHNNVQKTAPRQQSPARQSQGAAKGQVQQNGANRAQKPQGGNRGGQQKGRNSGATAPQKTQQPQQGRAQQQQPARTQQQPQGGNRGGQKQGGGQQQQQPARSQQQPQGGNRGGGQQQGGGGNRGGGQPQKGGGAQQQRGGGGQPQGGNKGGQGDHKGR